MVHLRSLWQMHGPRVTALAVLAVVWQLASLVAPAYLVPGLPAIMREFGLIFLSADVFRHLVLTIGRLLLGMAVSFVVGAALAIAMSLSPRLERYVMPLVEFVMGIPALALVVIIIIWVPFVELRVFVVLVLVGFPFFAIQILDGIKSVSKDLIEMLQAFRPTRRQLFRKLVLPGVVPAVLTSWKLTIAYGTRAVIIAELVGTTAGVGSRLLSAQERFEMDDALAWTLVLVAFLWIAQFILGRLEAHLLRWRPAALVVTEQLRAV